MKLRSLPGVKRDGTRFEGDYYVDALWCRFQRGLPRKMGGYRSIAQDLPERVYGLSSFSADERQYVHLGSANQLNQRVFNNLGVLVSSHDRTPAGLVPSSSNIWQFDQIFDVDVDDTVLVAHAAQNMDLANQTDADIFYGVVTDSGILLTSGQDPVSGGIIVVGNYLVGFGNGGYVQWSQANAVTSPTFSATNVTQQKIVAGRRVRGGGVPAALLWSLDAVLIMTFSPNPDIPEELWDFDVITDESSILSSRSVIEYDGVFYWAGVDRFLSYNGVVREVPNPFNVNFFFDNLNFEQRQKVYAYKVPRFGEIWWCFPKDDATECNHAVVYNVREGYWFDTPLPNEGRTDGVYAKVYFKPFMTGAEEMSGRFDLWQHETGVNQDRVGIQEAVRSYFETKEFSLVDAETPSDKAISVDFVEPDFVQSEDLRLTVAGRANARSPQIILPVNTRIFADVAADADDQVVRFKSEFRLITFKFDSNVLDGDYQAGENIAHIQPGDERITQ